VIAPTPTPTTSAKGAEVVVGIGDLQFARPPVRTIVTHALGSCIGVFAWDPETQRAGCLHFMLPRAEGGGEPAKYADTGLPLLLKGVAPDRSAARRLRLVACGGATMNTDANLFRIGARNVTALKQFLWHVGVTLEAHDLGGNMPRTARLDLTTGRVSVDSGQRSTLL
jgi:chemotaxis protein CheD